MKLTRDESVETGADQFIEKGYRERIREYVGSNYYASDLVGYGLRPEQICLRQVYYKYKSGKDLYKREKAGIFERGRTYETITGKIYLPAFGLKILNKLDDQGIPIQEELEYTHKGLKIHAHPDFEVEDQTGKRYIVEIKSTHFMSRQIFNDFCKEPDFPKEPHVLQANFYAHIKKLPYKLIYVSIGDMSFRGWNGEPDQSLFDVMLERVERLDEYIKKSNVPEGTTSWMCDMSQIKKPRSYCDAYNFCRQLGNYGPHPWIYGVCYKCKMDVPEADVNGHGIPVNEDGRMVCPDCSTTLIRKTLTKAKIAQFAQAKEDALNNNNPTNLPYPTTYKSYLE